ncbi:N-ethylammeline chlorohydrolase [Lasiodiplodia theobromae]|uniref:N-ethylammeline chlorohydrolase n=1 Tax=Lasiodiplodia theobromae TaxID=45133 RepID=UPI0015C3F583|nr:N-ethylammeline chlorohydrolase [Lasiodiplodia theobromae]KAF4535465.1 N-ethylammeline chlorohydrolase [Lasiodiplodia theobromae]
MTTASKITAMYLTWVIIGFGLGSAQSRDYNPLQTEHVYDAHVGADQHGPLARGQEAPTGTTNTDHEAALLDEPWNEVPHNAPQTLKAGVGS